MKFGVRTPSLKKRVAARTSWKRAVRHRAGLKAPRGAGWVTHPKKAAYNRVYNRTSVSVDRLVKTGSSSKRKSRSSQQVVYETDYLRKLNTNEDTTAMEYLGVASLFLGPILIFAVPPLGLIFILILIVYLYRSTTKPELKAKGKVIQAKKQLKKGKEEKAKILFKEALDLDGKNMTAVYFYGTLLHDAGGYKEAEKYLSKYLNGKPDTDEAYLYLADVFYQLKKYKQAIPILQKIDETHPKYLKALQLLGACFAAQKQYDMAIDTFKKGPLRKRKLDADLLELHYNLAVIYEESGGKKNALKHFKKVYTQDASYRDVAERLETLDK